MCKKVPRGHWKTTTFLAALRTSGLTAPLVVDVAVNGELFRLELLEECTDTECRNYFLHCGCRYT